MFDERHNTMHTRSRILLLTSDYGRGHRSAAAALARACADRFEVRVANPFRAGPYAALTHRSEQIYLQLIRRWPAGYAALYRATDHPAVAAALRRWAAHILQPPCAALLRTWPADAVVGVFPACTAGAGAAARTLGLSPLRVSVVTDMGMPHQLWLDPDDDLCTVADHSGAALAASQPHAPPTIISAGIPVDPGYATPADAHRAKAQLGWRVDLPAALITSGGAGIGGTLELAQALDAACLPIQLAMVAGSNGELWDALQRHRWRGAIALYGLLPSLRPLLQAADIVVTRAGGLSISEACAAGRPLIIHSATPGQEGRNRAAVAAAGAGVACPTTAAATEQIRRWVEQPQLRAAAAVAAAQLGRPQAAAQIAAAIGERLHCQDHAFSMPLARSQPPVSRHAENSG